MQGLNQGGRRYIKEGVLRFELRGYVFRDGRFLMNTAFDEPVSPISVILNRKAKP
jgi:hypothetical protein